MSKWVETWSEGVPVRKVGDIWEVADGWKVVVYGGFGSQVQVFDTQEQAQTYLSELGCTPVERRMK